MAPFPRLSHRHRIGFKTAVGVCARIAIILAVLLVIALAVLAWRVAGDGVSLAFLDETVRARIAARLGPDYVVDLDELDLGWVSGQGLTLTVKDLAVESSATGLRVAVPDLVLGFNPGAFLLGDLAPRTLKARDAALRLPILASDEGMEPTESTFATVNHALKTIRQTALDQGMRHLSLEGGKVDIMFGATSRDVQFWHEVALELDIRPDDRAVDLTLEATGPVGRGRFAAQYAPDADGNDRLTVKGSDFSLIDVVPAPEALTQFAAARLPLYPDMTIVFAPDDSIHNAHIEMVVGAGTVDIGEGDVALLDEARMQVTWDPQEKSFKLQPSVAEFGDTKFHFSGYLRPTTSDTLDRWRYGFDVTDAVVKPRDDPGPAVHVDRAHVEGRISASRRFLGIEVFEVDAGGRRIMTGVGSAGIGPDGPSIAMALEFAPIPALMVKRLWPNIVAAPARQWVLKNLIDADRVEGSAVFALGPKNLDGDPETYGWPDNSMDVSFRISNATVKTFGDLPNVSVPFSSARLRGGLFEFRADRASALTASKGKVDIRDVRFAIGDVRPPDKDADISFTLSGDTAAVAEIAAARPIDALKRIGVAPRDLSGKASVELEARFPLIKDLTIEDADWNVVAKLDNFASAKPINGQKVSDGNLRMTVDPKRAQITGRAKFDGLSVDVDLIEPLDGSSLNVRRDMTLVLTDAERKKRGIGLDPILQGPIGVAIDTGSNEKTRKLTVDLTSAALDLPGIGVVKKAGQRGTAQLVLVETGDGMEVRDLTLTASGLDIAGAAKISKAGKIVSANFDRFNVGDTKGAKLSLARASDGSLSITLNAQQLDARPSLRAISAKDSDKGGEGETLTIKASVDRLIGLNGVTLSNVSLNLGTAGGQTRRLDLAGVLGGSDRFNATIRPDGGKRYLSVVTTDMGSALRMLDFYDRMRGGHGKLEATLVGTGRSAGTLKLRNFAISDDPGLREIIRRTQSNSRSTNNRTLPVQVTAASKSGSANFERLDVTYSMNGDQIKVGDAVLRGTIIGGTMRGTVDLKKKQIDMVGTMVPAYGINNLFGRIPLLGEFVGGGSDGGLIGITFKMEGPIEDAKLVFNPVSAVAPGIFRKIFEYR